MGRASTSWRAVIGVLAMTWSGVWLTTGSASFAQQVPSPPHIWTVPEIGALPNNAYGRLVRRGRDLITATYAYIGPEVANRSKRFAGNNLAEEIRDPLVLGFFRGFSHYNPPSRAPRATAGRFNLF